MREAAGMKAIVKYKEGKGFVELREVPVPTPGPQEVRIHVESAGICASDLHILNYDIAITIKPEIASMRWPPDVEYAAFMIAREALENVFRHSLASLVHVILYGSAQSLHLDVEDDGVGGATGLIPKTGHLGILGMQERAHAAGATLNIEPRDIKGTRVSFSWQPTS